MNVALAACAATDPLTGLANRHGAPCSVLAADLDHFKQLNDARGHLAGDQVLRAVARVLAASVRAQDLVARTGGDEFLVLLPEADLATATAIAARVQTALGQADLPGQPGGCTLSSSVACSPPTSPRIHPCRLQKRLLPPLPESRERPRWTNPVSPGSVADRRSGKRRGANALYRTRFTDGRQTGAAFVQVGYLATDTVTGLSIYHPGNLHEIFPAMEHLRGKVQIMCYPVGKTRAVEMELGDLIRPRWLVPIHYRLDGGC